jgi:YidC/Oxa1 family membrane protein insertase
MQRELMDLYKKNNHSPFGGCLPMLLQMPVLFSLWSMLQAVFELRNAPFIGWIQNLSGKDPYYVLPILMGLGMIAQTAMTPAMGDPQQRKIMMFMMPAMMVFIFAQSPAGLCLYYTVFTLIGLGQTWWVKRSYVSQPIKV